MSEEHLPGPKPLLRIEGYEILREIGRGGQAFVYQARQETTNRKVAIKVLRKFAEANDEAAARFVREIRLMAQLTHPHVVSILHSGQLDDGRHYYVMEYIRGLPARQHVVENNLPMVDTLRLFATICRAVGHLHRHGVVHRDVKPSNILVDESGAIKLLDFGLAKNLATPAETMATTSGVVLGSLLYMSPEQARGQTHNLTPRTDVYSLGVLLFELLTGAFPYAVTGQIQDVIHRIMESTPMRPSQAWLAAARKRADAASFEMPCPIDTTLDAICLRAMEKDAPRRYADANELADDVDRYLAGEPTVARPERWVERSRRRIRHMVRRRRAGALVVCAVVAFALANYPGIQLVFIWTPLARWFDRAVVSTSKPADFSAPFEHARIIAITDKTDIAGIASRENCTDVRVDVRPSLRRLHGRLMTRLADSDCRVVIWDIAFPGATTFDNDFVAGAKALRAAGIDVVVAIKNWWLDDGAAPELSPNIAPHVRWGCVAAGLSGSAPWKLQIFARRGSSDPLLGLALEGYAASLHPLTVVRVDTPTGRLDAEKVTLSFRQSHAKRWSFQPRQLTAGLSAVRPAHAIVGLPPDRFGLRDDDAVGFLEFTLPSQEVLDAATVDYQTAFEADKDALRRMFSGRAVLIGDARETSRDLHDHAGGRRLPGVTAHAMGLESFTRGAPIRLPNWIFQQLVPLLGAFLGVIIAVSCRIRRSSVASLFLAVPAVVVSSIAVYRQFGYLVNPFMAILPLLIAWAMASAVERVARVQRV